MARSNASNQVLSFRLSLQVGHGQDRQVSPIAVQRIKRFVDMMPEGGTTDLRGPGARSLRALSAGVHLLVLETDNTAKSHLPAVRFNSYLRAEGLLPALAFRSSRALQEEDGSERYSRIAKALLDVGPKGASKQELATTALGLALEIVL